MRLTTAIAAILVVSFSAPSPALAKDKKPGSQKKAKKPTWELAIRDGEVVLKKAIWGRNGVCVISRTGSDTYRATLSTKGSNYGMKVTYVTKTPWYVSWNSSQFVKETRHVGSDIAGVTWHLTCGATPQSVTELLPMKKPGKVAKK